MTIASAGGDVHDVRPPGEQHSGRRQCSDHVACHALIGMTTLAGSKPRSTRMESQPTELLPTREGSGPPASPRPHGLSLVYVPSLNWRNSKATGERAVL